MIKKLFFLFAMLLLVCCDAYKPMFIFSRFTIKPNTNTEAFKIIDTTSIYKEIASVNLTYNTKQQFKDHEYHNYIRFRKNGELVKLRAKDLTDWKSREAKLKRLQRYNYGEKGFYIEYHYRTIQGGWSIWKAELIKHTHDSLFFKHADYIKKYVRMTIPE
ncbi:hypothetical protein ACJD0Z_02210 [Flavobacteriaceae bacterium M23B6Z8]